MDTVDDLYPKFVSKKASKLIGCFFLMHKFLGHATLDNRLIL
ncbi:hypothetical protein E9U_05726 [Moraxella catarrhalis BC8]|nr:hypothetical protein E9U_05726 [Moraxella catarrhalis BC8]